MAVGLEEEGEVEGVGTLSRRVDLTIPGLDPPSKSLSKACHRYPTIAIFSHLSYGTFCREVM